MLSKWGRSGLLNEALAVLHSVELHHDVMQTVQAIRRLGIRFHIASNQQALRAKHMSEGLNYGSLFDSEFYSCFIGSAKPNARDAQASPVNPWKPESNLRAETSRWAVSA